MPQARKKKRVAKKSRYKGFDKYEYYHAAVQSPDADCEFVVDTYKELRGKKPTVLREDFCGTFAVCCNWVKLSKNNRAIGVDLDPEPLSYGRENYLSKLKPEQKKRVNLIKGSVLTAPAPLADVTIALNFSYFIFKSRLLMKKYFMRARKGLKPGGLMIIDAFGGPAALEPNKEVTKIGHFQYLWDQTGFNPVTNEAVFHIHFRRKGEKIRRDVFTYDWRLWGIPELRDIMMEAGFRRTHVYWEGTNRKGYGDGNFKRTEKGDDAEGWVTYIVGEV